MSLVCFIILSLMAVSLVQLISRQSHIGPLGLSLVLPIHTFIKVEIWDTLLISSLSIKKIYYIIYNIIEYIIMLYIIVLY